MAGLAVRIPAALFSRAGMPALKRDHSREDRARSLSVTLCLRKGGWRCVASLRAEQLCENRCVFCVCGGDDELAVVVSYIACSFDEKSRAGGE